jgi:hypothetical protein
MAVWLSASRAGHPLPLGRFLVLISVKRLSLPQGDSAAGSVRSIKKSSDIGNRTRDLPACSTVPQPTTLPRAPNILCVSYRNRSIRRPLTCPSVFVQWNQAKLKPVFILNDSSSEYWSVLCPSIPVFGNLRLRLRNQLQFKCDTFRSLTPYS